MKIWAAAILTSLLSASAGAQVSDDVEGIEAELNAVQGKAETPVLKVETAAEEKSRKTKASRVDAEMRMQEKVLQRKLHDEAEISSDRNVDRFPKDEPLFTRPPGPTQGGTIRVEHPKAAEGLIRINRDGSYQYRTQVREKSRSSAFKVGMMTPPKISTNNSAVTYETMYGDQDIFSMEFDYQWQPFQKYGALGLKVGAGFATVSARGYFKTQSAGRSRSEESYNLFILPLSAFLEYRFEYARRQWVVPFVNAGGTYYGLTEIRNDGQAPVFAGAPALGVGGGALFSISRLDAAGAFTLSQEYGIADMWLIVEARAMQGLSEDTDFSNQTISAGIAVDF